MWLSAAVAIGWLGLTGGPCQVQQASDPVEGEWRLEPDRLFGPGFSFHGGRVAVDQGGFISGGGYTVSGRRLRIEGLEPAKGPAAMPNRVGATESERHLLERRLMSASSIIVEEDRMTVWAADGALRLRRVIGAASPADEAAGAPSAGDRP